MKKCSLGKGTWGRRGGHEDSEHRDTHHVDSQLPEVSIELSREPQGRGDPGHSQGDQVVQVAVGRVGQLQGSGTNDQFRITTQLKYSVKIINITLPT